MLSQAPGGAETDGHVGTVEDLLAALRQDPVQVDQLRGNGRTAEVDAALTELAAAADVPVHVALVGDLPGLTEQDPAGDLVTRMHQSIGEDGIYVAAADIYSPTWTYYGDDPDLARAVQEGVALTYDHVPADAEPGLSDAGRVALILEVVADDDHQIDRDTTQSYAGSSTWRAPEDLDAGEAMLPSAVGALAAGTGLLVALVTWRLGRTWVLRAAGPPVRQQKAASTRATAATPRTPAKHPSRPSSSSRSPDLASVRADAGTTLDKLADDLVRHATSPGSETALGCRVSAERLLDSRDLLDVVGALVLARTGRAALHGTSPAYRPCYVNPLHGRASVEVALPVAGSATTVPVPTCKRCRTLDRHPEAADPLREPPGLLGGPGRPYYEGDTVWARTGFGALDGALWRTVAEEGR